ncbi:MAG: hypothetical protein ACOX6T_22715, partial [Myxococcales bacterium]
MRRALLSLTAIACACLSSGAVAQTLYVVSPPSPGVAPTYTGWTTVRFDSEDDGETPALSLPFPFVFYGTQYSSLQASTNGLLLFSNTYCGPSSGCYNNSAIPSSSSPNNFIAFWWDDMRLRSTGSAAYTVAGAAPDRVFSIKYQGWQDYSDGSPRDVQVDLHERSGAIVIYYGAISRSSADTADATIGIE